MIQAQKRVQGHPGEPIAQRKANKFHFKSEPHGYRAHLKLANEGPILPGAAKKYPSARLAKMFMAALHPS
jgi:hypothetical protein